MSPALPHAEALARLEARLRDARERAARAPLPPFQLQQLERAVADAVALVPVIQRAIAALEQNRGLALEDERALRVRVIGFDAEATLLVVTEHRRAGRIRAALRAYLAFLRRAPLDERFADRLAGFSHLLEEYQVNPAAGITRSTARTLGPAWWRSSFAVVTVADMLRDLWIDWDRLPG